MREQTGFPPLVRFLRERIRESGERGIPFSEYMRHCLYHPAYGYYVRNIPKIGKEGDFYTSASVGTVMGRMLARFLARRIGERKESSAAVMEWGSGTGTLGKHILDELSSSFPEVYRNLAWCSVETSPYHAEVQRKNLHVHRDKVRIVRHFDEVGGKWPGPVFVVANELLDAFPVHRVRFNGSDFEEAHVGYDESGHQFVEQFGPLSNRVLTDRLTGIRHYFGKGQRADIHLEASDWIEEIGRRLSTVTLVLIDYGDVEEEIYSRHRMNGTLMCYRRHMAHDNPYVYAGEQDITAHVDFSELIRKGKEAGFQLSRFSTQKQFLLDEGVFDLLQDHCSSDPFSRQARQNRSVRQLLLSDAMSELFKVLVMDKAGLRSAE